MDKKQILKTGVHLIPAILTIALILGCASRPDLEKIPEKLEPAEEEIVMEEEEEQEVREGDFDDGVYEGSAEGYGGPVKVKVTVEERQITDIEILDASKETDSFFSRAKAIVDDILRLQSWDVDVVSGATFSSNGIKGAVQNALTGKEVKTEKATKTSSGNSSALKKTSFTAPSGGYKDGTYTGSAQGFGGSIGVSVSISGGKITAVNITSASGETPSYLSSAKGVVSRILSKQTPNVDTVSGATYSSIGILNAVKEALNKASGTNSGSKNSGISSSNTKKQIPNYHYKDGTYTGVGEGYGGDIKVTVTVKNGQITNVKVDSAADETPAYFNRAKSLLTTITEKQKWDLDAVTGATFSSEGILEAVSNAMTSASGSKNPTSSVTYHDGVYTGTGTGYDNVKLRARVTIKNGKITSVEILQPDTDSALYQKSAGGVIEAIIKNQRWDVDSIVGATYSSNGIKEAVAEALAQAEKGTGSSNSAQSADAEAKTSKVTATVTVNPDENEDFEPYEMTLTLTVKTENGKKTVIASEVNSDTNKINKRYLDKAFEGMQSGLTGNGIADEVSSATCSSKAIQSAWTQTINK